MALRLRVEIMKRGVITRTRLRLGHIPLQVTPYSLRPRSSSLRLRSTGWSVWRDVVKVVLGA
jgi:hypothetical protein